MIGRSLGRLDGEDKVRGALHYGADLYEKGMLFAKVLRSEYASAEILGINTARAQALPGVVGIYTAADVRGTNRTGLIRRDHEVLVTSRVRFMGDAVAIVVAETEAAAQEALTHIKVDYQPTQPVLTIDEALAPDAPKLHEYGNLMGGKRIRKGDAERALREECDVVLEETFDTQTVDHAFLDLEAGCAQFDGNILTLWVSGQWVHEEQRLCALALGVPVEKLRIIQPATGGAFGGREDISIQIYLGIAALENPGRKVFLRYSREESMRARHKRHAIRCRYTLGAKRDGTLVAAKVTVWSDEGAYASTGLAVQRKASSHATGPYRVPHVHVDVYGVHTNNNPTGAMRGFGAVQMAIAYEGMLDRLAAKLGMDRVELRRRNLLRSGEAVTTTQVVPVVTVRECMDAALARFARTEDPAEADRIWKQRSYDTDAPWLRRGYGVSVACFGLGYGDSFPDASRARVRFNDAGLLEIHSGAVEVGQGILTMMAQVASGELGVPVEQVRVIAADTATTPEAGSSSATRQTYFTGNAVKLASSELREQLFDLAGTYLGVHPFEIVSGDGKVYERANPANAVPLQELLEEGRRRGYTLEASALFRPHTIRENLDTGLTPRAFVTYIWASHICQVLVDTDTGEVRVERHIAAHDVGKAINPQAVEGQIQGGVAQGIGMALMEEVLYSEKGKLQNAGFTDYIIPGLRDVPFIEPVILEHADPGGPFGARGIGEPPLIAAVPAVLSAIADATGIPVSRLPVTPERLWRMLHEGGA